MPKILLDRCPRFGGQCRVTTGDHTVIVNVEFRSRTLVLCAILCVCASTAPGQDAASGSERLKNDQSAISGRFSRLERAWSQMADMLRHEDPEYAELLRRVISKGREEAIGPELDLIVERLGGGDFGTALEKQREVAASLQLMMKLLQSEDRRSAVEKERDRLNGILNDVRDTIAAERAARGAALNAKAPSSAAPAQQKALRRADGILSEIEEHDGEPADGGRETEDNSGDGENSSGESDKGSGSPNESGNESSDGDTADKSGDKADKSGDSESSDSSNDGSADSENNGSDDTSDQSSSESPSAKTPESDPNNQQGAGNPSSQQSDSESQQSSDQQSGNSPPPNNAETEEQTPGTKNIAQARNLMQEALEQLQDQNRETAVEKQDDALAELQRAEKELEELLKQLREEEKEMILAALEARLQRLLAVQTQINDTTVDLAATPRDKWLDNAVSKCRDLSHQQSELTQECSRTTGLLREDGTSVSILLAMEDVEEDMGSVTVRLRETRVGSLTQSIEQDIVESLEELIRATQTEMEEMKSEQRQQGQQQQGQNQDKPPLVELMAEIRVLRSLQKRVNRRTRQVHQLLSEADAASDPDLRTQLNSLADRQDRLRESATELATRMEQGR